MESNHMTISKKEQCLLERKLVLMASRIAVLTERLSEQGFKVTDWQLVQNGDPCHAVVGEVELEDVKTGIRHRYEV